MRQLISIFKGEYNTLRELERKSYRLFYLGAGSVGVGILLTLSGFGLLTFIGLPLIILGILIFLVGMIWIVGLQKQPTVPIYCPYCAGRNDLFRGRKEFFCDMCGRRIVITPAGEAVPGEPEDAAD